MSAVHLLITTQSKVTFLGASSGNNTVPIGMISSNLFVSTLMGLRNKFDSYSIFFGGKIEADSQLWFGSGNISNKAANLASNGQNISLTRRKSILFIKCWALCNCRNRV